MTKEQINAVLESVRSWPQQDQEELADLAREIEARRTGVYTMTDEERAACVKAWNRRNVESSCPTMTWRHSGKDMAYRESSVYAACAWRYR
jgi:hypothetical protein